MIDPKYNYRKAKAGDVKCCECEHCSVAYQSSLTCMFHEGEIINETTSYGHRVARNNTCDKARRSK